jgi:hypothetical protein
VNEWGILVGKVLLKRPKGVPEEHLRQAGFQEEIPASLDFYEFWKLARRSAKPVSTSLQISRWLVSQPRAALHEGYVRSTTRSMP